MFNDSDAFPFAKYGFFFKSLYGHLKSHVAPIYSKSMQYYLIHQYKCICYFNFPPSGGYWTD